MPGRPLLPVTLLLVLVAPVWGADAPGSLRTPDTKADDAKPDRKPRGTFLIWTEEKTDQLWVLDSSGKKVRQLGECKGTGPAVRPDGEAIAFLSTEGICVVGRDGKKPRVILKGKDFWDQKPAYQLRYTPDGKSLLFMTVGKGCWDVHLLDVATGKSRKLSLKDVSSMPAVSPDGKRIAFTRYVGEPSRHQLFIADLTGKNEKALTDPKKFHAIDPSFTDDGKIVFIGQEGPGASLTSGIYRIDADGKNCKLLFSSGRLKTDLAVSPDGSRCCYRTGGPYNFSLMLVDLKKEKAIKVGDGHHVAAWGSGDAK
jgi:Tol biopolymer transport system component